MRHPLGGLDACAMLKFKMRTRANHSFLLSLPNQEHHMPADLLAPQIAALDLAQFMRAALYEAEQAGLAGELPIGAVLVIDRQIVSRGRAQHQARQSQLMHAELNALLDAGLPLWEHYHNALLFTTVEPCPMCLGAVVMADVPHIIFAAHDAVVHSQISVMHNPYVRRHIQSYYGGVLEAKARALIARFNPAMLHYITTQQLDYETRSLQPRSR
jgi:tRNA(adenine34) deaminase